MRRTYFFATALLVTVALTWIWARYQVRFPEAHAAWPWIIAFTEAGLVGALADWFAVTALFRRPLGLPIPHTAIIPNKRDQIADTLGRFVEENFLSEQVLGDRIRDQQVANRLGTWLLQDGNAALVAERVLPLLKSVVDLGGTSTLRQALGKGLQHGAQGLDVATLTARLVRASTDQENLAPLLDAVLKTSAQLLRGHAKFLQDSIARELPWYVPRFVHDRIYREVISRLQSRLDAAMVDSQNSLRIQITQGLKRFATELETTPSLRSAINDAFRKLATHSELAAFIDTLSDALMRELGSALSRNEFAAKAAIASTAAEFGQAIGAQNQFAQSLNSLAERAARGFARHYRHAVGRLISDTMRRWESTELVAKIEAEVGDDLAFIRINGTIVGGLFGLVLHAIVVLW